MLRRIMLAVSLAAMLTFSAGPAMANESESFTEIENDVPFGAEVFTFVEDGDDSALLLDGEWDEWGDFEDGDFVVLGDEWFEGDGDDDEFDTVNEGDEGSVWQIIA